MSAPSYLGNSITALGKQSGVYLVKHTATQYCPKRVMVLPD